jgi:hypothetical protein
MSRVFFPNEPSGVFQVLEMPDFGISWAGANPLGEGFCLGSERGHIVLTDTKGQPISLLGRASASGEAINGVAFSRNWLAVTTRKDVNFIPLSLLDSRHLEALVISGGASDVAVAPSGHFVIPLGRAGLMVVNPGLALGIPVLLGNPEHQGPNFSQVVTFAGQGGTDLIVCAGRRGVGFTTFREGSSSYALNTVRFRNLDIVAVCSIGVPQQPLALVAASRDGSLIFFRDIVHDKNPQTLKFKGVSGTVYRVLSARGDIYLLTSHGLFGLFKLADDFRAGVTAGEFTTNILRIPVEASDANIVDQKWLLAAGVDRLFVFDVQSMPRSPEESSVEAKPGAEAATNGHASWGAFTPQVLEAAPVWEESGLQQKAEAMAAAG